MSFDGKFLHRSVRKSSLMVMQFHRSKGQQTVSSRAIPTLLLVNASIRALITAATETLSDTGSKILAPAPQEQRFLAADE